MERALYTVGHSTHTLEHFISLLQKHGVDAVCDVRSSPHSYHNPQFNQKPLKAALAHHRIFYVPLGKELGARTDDPSCYENGQAKYHLIAQTRLFCTGLERLQRGMGKYKITLMCAEKDPLTCHRTILVTRSLRSDDLEIRHILGNGQLELGDAAEARLLKLVKLPESSSLFADYEEIVNQAYDIQAEKIAYRSENKPESEIS